MKKGLFVVLLPLLSLCSCSKKDTIIIGASSVPHAEILEIAKPLFEANSNYKMEITIFNDYVTPNLALDSGDINANYFQHTPYLDDFNLNNGTKLSAAFKVHFEPLGIYSTKHESLSSGLVVAIPNDTSNGNRARDLLAAHNITPSRIIEAEAQSLPALLADVDYACINGNYALSSGVIDKCIVTESTESQIAQTNANIVAVRTSDLNSTWLEDLRKAILSPEVKSFIQTKYGSSVIAMF